jgi:hypothetical protein
LAKKLGRLVGIAGVLVAESVRLTRNNRSGEKLVLTQPE